MSNLEKLLQNLKDGDLSLKKLSIQALVKLPYDEAVIQAIISAADTDASEDIRYYARKALAFIEKKTGKPIRSIGEVQKQPSGDVDPKKMMETVKSIAASRDSSRVKEIVNIIKMDAHAVVTASAAKVLALIAGEQSLSIMAGLIEHNDPRVRANAVEGLNLIKSSKTLPILMISLKDSDNRVKANALAGVEKFNSVNIAKAFQGMINSTKISHRDSAIWASIHLKDKSIADILFKSFESEKDQTIKINILEALGKRLPREVLKGFEKIALTEQNLEIKSKLQKILIDISGKGDALIKRMTQNIVEKLAGSSSLSDPEPTHLSKKVAVSSLPEKNQKEDIHKIVNQKLSELDKNPDSLDNLRSKDSESSDERKAKALAAMLLVPMGKPQSAVKNEKTHDWESIESLLGDKVDPDALSSVRKQELSDFISTIEVWRNNGFNVEPLFRALNKSQSDLEMIFDKYASLIQRCNKLTTKFKRLDVSIFKDETVDISLNLKNPTLVETLEQKVDEFENRTSEMKLSYHEKLEKFKSSGFDVKKLELVMIENLKTIRDEFSDFEQSAGGLLELQQELQPYRCKVFSEYISRIDRLFNDVVNAPVIKEEIEKLKKEFDKKLQEYSIRVQECEDNKKFDTIKLKKAYEKKDLDLIELQLKNYSELINMASSVEKKLKNLDQEAFHDELSALRKKLENPAASKEVNFELDELLERQNNELAKLREYAEKWSKDGYDVSSLFAACNESFTWSRKVFEEFAKENSLEMIITKPFGSMGKAVSVISSNLVETEKATVIESVAVSDELQQSVISTIESDKNNTVELPTMDSIGDQLGEDGFPPIEWWNLDTSILVEYADEGDTEPVLQPDFDNIESIDETEGLDSKDAGINEAIKASKEIAESIGELTEEQRKQKIADAEKSFDALKIDEQSLERDAERNILGEEISSDDVKYEIDKVEIDLPSDKDTKADDKSILFAGNSPEDTYEELDEQVEKKAFLKRFSQKYLIIAVGVVGIFFIIFIFIGFRYYRENYSASYHTDIGIDFINKKKYKYALKSFDRAVSIDPAYAKAGLARLKLFIAMGTEQGEVLSNREKYLIKADQVIKEYHKTGSKKLKKQLHSYENDLKHNLAKLYLEITGKRKLNFKEKVELLTKAYKLNPKGKQAIEIQISISDLHFKEKNYKETISILNELKKKGVTLKKVSYYLAKSYYELFMISEDEDEKILYLEKAVALQGDSKYKTKLQNLYQKKSDKIGQMDERIGLLIKAYKLDQTNVPLRDKVIEMLHENVRISMNIDDKLAAYEKLREYEPNNEKNYKEIIRLNYKKALQTKDPLKRLEILKFVKEKSFEKDDLLMNHIKQTYIEIGDNQKENESRETWYRQAYDIDPTNKEICSRLSKVFLIRGNNATKFTLKELNYKNALKYYPESEDVTLIYASMHYNRGVTSTDTKEKIFYYDRALEIDKQFVEVYNNLAVQYSKKGSENNPREMYKNLKYAYNLDPEDEIVKHNLALMFYNHAVSIIDKDQKIRLYKKALEIDSSLEAARENHKLLITKVFRVKDKFGKIIMKSASEMEIKEKPAIEDYKTFGPVNMDYLVSQIIGSQNTENNDEKMDFLEIENESKNIDSEDNADL